MSNFFKGMDANGALIYVNIDHVRTIEKAKDDPRRLIFWHGGSEYSYMYCTSEGMAEMILNEMWIKK